MASCLIFVSFLISQIFFALSGAEESTVFEDLNFEVFAQKKSFTDAQEFCEARGKTLVETRSEATRAFVIAKTRELKSPIWTGANRRNRDDGVFEWESHKDETDIPEDWWQFGDPQTTGFLNEVECVLMRECGKLDDFNCKKKFAFICQDKVPLDRGQCERGYPVDGLCYFFNKAPLSYQAAWITCFFISAKLAEPRTERLRNSLIKANEYWQRFITESEFASEYKEAESTDIWIGANDIDEEGTFVWQSDSQPANFSSDLWVEGQPDNDGGDDDGVVMTLDGKLKDETWSRTSFKLFYYACQEPVVPPKPCRAYVNGKCFQYFSTPREYSFSKVVCNRHCGEYADVKTAAYREALVSMIGQYDFPVWIQADKLRDVSLDLWAAGQPNFSDACDKCAILSPDGQVYAVTCDQKYAFFCLVDPMAPETENSS